MPGAWKTINCLKCRFSYDVPRESAEVLCPKCGTRMKRKIRRIDAHASAKTGMTTASTLSPPPEAANSWTQLKPGETAESAAFESQPHSRPTPTVLSGGSQEARDPWRRWLASALAAGLLSAVALSLLKANLAMSGLVACGAAFALVGAAASIQACANARTSLSRTGARSPEHARAEAKARNVTMASVIVVVLVGCGMALEVNAPPEGVARSMFKAKEAPLPPSRPKPTFANFMEAAAHAEIVLIDPSHCAVALRYEPKAKRFHVVAKHATDDSFSSPIGIPWARIAANGQRVVAESPELAQTVHENHTVGDFVQGESHGRLAALYHEHHFLPAGAPLISFVDVKSQKRRVGFLLAGDPRDEGTREFLFCGLTPRVAQTRLKLLSGSREASPTPGDLERLSRAPEPADLEIERIPRSRISLDSLESRLEDETLKSQADFLDYAIYQIAKALETQAGRADYVRVAIVDGALDTTALERMVQAAELLNQRQRLKSEADAGARETRPDQEPRPADRERKQVGFEKNDAENQAIGRNAAAGAIAAEADSFFSHLIAKPPALESKHLAQVTGELQESRDFRRSPLEQYECNAALRDLLDEIKRLEGLAKTSSRIAADIESRLLMCGVPLASRQPNQMILIQMEGAREHLLRDQPSQLMGVTHVVFPIVQEAENAEQDTHLEIRLIDMSGKILWTGVDAR